MNGDSDISEEQRIIDAYEMNNGFIPNPLRLMAEREGVLSGFMNHGMKIFEGGPLNEKECYLVSLAAAVALKSENCIRAHTMKVRKAGATDEEILQAILIAGFLGNTSSMQVAYEASGLFPVKQ